MRQYLVCAMLAVSVSAQAGVVLERPNDAGGKLIATDERNANCQQDEMLFISQSSKGEFLLGCWSSPGDYQYIVVHYFRDFNGNPMDARRMYDFNGWSNGPVMTEWLRTHPNGKSGTVY